MYTFSMVIIAITGGHPKKYSKADRTVGGSVSGVRSFFLDYFGLISGFCYFFWGSIFICLLAEFLG